MTTWFISDQHFSHRNILNFEQRPYSNLEEMEEGLIKAWNNAINKNDKIFMLGDFCFGKYSKWVEILEQLKSYNTTLVLGNHDDIRIVKKLHEEGYLKEYHEVGCILNVDKFQLNLSHYPLQIGERPWRYNLSGHIHNVPNQHKNQINVGVDSQFMHDYYKNENVPFGTPVPLEYIMKHIKVINEELLQNYKAGAH